MPDRVALRSVEEPSDLADAYGRLFEDASDAIFVLDGTGSCIAANRRACAMAGRTEHELRGVPPPIETVGVAAGDADAVPPPAVVVRTATGPLAVELRQLALGRDRHALIVHDVSDRETVRRQLLERDRQFRLAQTGARVAVWDWCPASGRGSWSAEMEVLFGYQPGTVTDAYEAFLRRVHPDDLERVSRFREDAIAEGRPFDFDFRIVLPAGVRWINCKGTSTWDTASDATRVVGVNIDVTDRKVAEDALRESEARFRLLFDGMAEGVAYCRMIYDEADRPVDWVYLGANASHERFCGIQDLTGHRITEFFPGLRDVAPELFEVCGRVARTGEGTDFEGWMAPLEQWVRVSLFSPERDHFVAIGEDITERKRTEQAVGRLAAIVEWSDDAIIGAGPNGEIATWNPAATRLFGYTPEEAIGHPFSLLRFPDDVADVAETLQRLQAGESIHLPDAVRRRKDGSAVEVSMQAFPIRDADGKPVAGGAIFRDVSARNRAERERQRLHDDLAQAQKMEFVGRLVGGIAHDSNNMLSIILGNVELALLEVDAGHPVRDHLIEIRTAGERSSELTRQLLAFARRQTAAPELIDLNERIAGTLKMLRRLIGEDVALSWMPGGAVGAVRIDPVQVDQVLTNLCINARDAITGAGTITIETRDVTIAPSGGPDPAPGEYVLLAVRDDGRGMDEAAREHAFEPFFTTKPRGQGTGLGLATVYGIVRQNDGFVRVESEIGRGTSIEVYLPRRSGRPASIEAGASATAAPLEGRECVLLVEDEAAMLKVARVLLERLGYRVLAASSPGEALRLADAHAAEIDLLLTDVIMPEMTGRELADRLGARVPGLPCLFTSGYSADVISQHGVLASDVQFVQKPYSMGELATKVRRALGDRTPGD